MAITPEVPGGIDAPVAKTAEAAGTVAIPASKTAEAVGVVAVPIAKTAEAAGTVAVPIAKTAESVGTVSIPASKTAESVGVVAVPIAKTAETAGTVAVPNTLTASGVAAFPRALTPALNLDFKNGLYAQNGTPKAQSDLITYSRNSSASYLDRFIDANGDWNYFLNTDYVGSVTNLITYSEQFELGGWTLRAATVEPVNEKSPVGSIGVYKLVGDGTADYHSLYNSSETLAGNSFSIYLKSDGNRYASLSSHYNSAPNTRGAVFDIISGVVSDIGAGVSASIEPVGNDWFRVSIAEGDAPSTIFAVILAQDADTLTYTDDAASGVFVWGAQRSAGTKMLPYVKTIAASASETFTESLRIEYDAATGQSLGALIETASTNLFLRSEEIDNASWTKASTSVSANSTKAPDNTTSSEKVAVTSTGTSAPNFAQSVTSIVSSAYTISMFVKRAEASYLQFFFGVGDVANNPRINFDLGLGVLGTQDADIDNASIIPVGNDWFRVSATVTAADTVLLLNAVFIQSATDARAATNAWTAGDGLYVWGGQIEAQKAPTSYIRTEGSTVSRLADLVSAPIAGNVPNSGDVTFYSDISALYNYGTSRSIYNIDSQPVSNLGYYNSSDQLAFRHGDTIDTNPVGLYKQGTAVMSYSGNSNLMSTYFNGSLLETIAAGVQNTNDISGVIGIGNNNALTTAQLNGHIKKFTIYDKALTAQEVALL